MKYFNALADAAFKDDPEGDGWLFYPNGVIGKGRIVEEDEVKAKLHRFMVRFYVSGFLLILPLAFLVFAMDNFFIPVVLISAWSLIAYLRLGYLVKDLPKSPVRLKYMEALSKSFRGLPRWHPWAGIILGSLLIIIALVLLVLDDRAFEKAVTMFMLIVGLGVLGIALGLFELWLFRKLDRDYPVETTDVADADSAGDASDLSIAVHERPTPGTSHGVKPVYLVVLIAAAALFFILMAVNPHKKFSSSDYWQAATLADVAAVPDEALLPGNNNGSVLMWAAMSTPDPDVLSALIERGADVNESDPVFSGTPLSAAAGYSRHPEIIERLVEHGADVNKTVNNGETPLHIAARYNTHPEIFHALIEQGANIEATNARGFTPQDLAVLNKNQVAIDVLTTLIEEAEKQ